MLHYRHRSGEVNGDRRGNCPSVIRLGCWFDLGKRFDKTPVLGTDVSVLVLGHICAIIILDADDVIIFIIYFNIGFAWISNF